MLKDLKKQLELFKKFYLTPHQATGPIPSEDFELRLEKVNLADYIQTLQNSVLEPKVVEEIIYKKEKFPILQLDWNRGKADKRLLVLAGVHGNEIAGTLAILDLVEDIKHRPDSYKNWHIQIITPVNPVGVAYQSRYNEDGRDLNRDFKDFQAVGARLQRDVVEAFNPTIVVTLHESSDKDFFMFSEGRLAPVFKDAITSQLRATDIPLTKTNYFHIKLQDGFWEKPPIIFFMQRVLGIYTLGRYLYEKHIPTITTESCWSGKNIALRRRPHLEVIRAIVKT